MREAIPAGRYPAPFVHGARTFLPGTLSGLAGTAVRPTDGIGVGAATGGVKFERREWLIAKKARTGPGGGTGPGMPFQASLRVLEG